MKDLLGESEQLIELYNDHSHTVRSCLKCYVKAMKQYISEGFTEEVSAMRDEVKKLETEADEVRRKIVRLLIEKRFLIPNTRRDFLNLLKFTDKVADYSESSLDYVVLQSMDITEVGQQKLQEILEITESQFEKLEKAIGYVFDDNQKAFDLVNEIGSLESEIDNLERELIDRLSRRDDLSFGLKSLYRDYLTMMANISDIIEDAADEIELIIALKRL